MKCDEVRLMLDADELPEDAARLLAEHRRQCADCDAEFAWAETLRQDIGALAEPRMPQIYWKGYEARLRMRLAESRATPWWRRAGLWRYAAAVLLAGALLAAAYLIIWGSPDALPQHGMSADAGADRVEALPPVATGVNIEALRQEVAALELYVAALEMAERRNRLLGGLRQKSQELSAEDRIERELERTASYGVSRGNRLAADVRTRAEAIEAYRQVIALFPQTFSASVARARLAELENSRGEIRDEKEPASAAAGGGHPADVAGNVAMGTGRCCAGAAGCEGDEQAGGAVRHALC